MQFLIGWMSNNVYVVGSPPRNSMSEELRGATAAQSVELASHVQAPCAQVFESDLQPFAGCHGLSSLERWVTHRV